MFISYFYILILNLILKVDCIEECLSCYNIQAYIIIWSSIQNLFNNDNIQSTRCALLEFETTFFCLKLFEC